MFKVAALGVKIRHVGGPQQGFLGSFQGAGLSLRLSIYTDKVALLPVALTVSTHHVVLSQKQSWS